jgi:hypothetical protein
MSLIESTYQKLSDYNDCSSSEDFSIRYLRRSKSYYRTIKAMGKEPSYEVLCNLMMELEKKIDEYPRNMLYRNLSLNVASNLVSKINVRNVCSKTTFRTSVLGVEPS